MHLHLLRVFLSFDLVSDHHTMCKSQSENVADAVGNGVWLMQSCYYRWGNYAYAHRIVESEMSNGTQGDSDGLLLICF